MAEGKEEMHLKPVNIDTFVLDSRAIANKHLKGDFSIAVENAFTAMVSKRMSNNLVDIVVDNLDKEFSYNGFIDIDLKHIQPKLDPVLEFTLEFFKHFLSSIGYASTFSDNFSKHMQSLLREILISNHSKLDGRDGTLHLHYTFSLETIFFNIYSPQRRGISDNDIKVRPTFHEMSRSDYTPQRWTMAASIMETIDGKVDPQYKTGDKYLLKGMIDKLEKNMHLAEEYSNKGDYRRAVNVLMAFSRFYEAKLGGGEVFTRDIKSHINEISNGVFNLASCYSALESIRDTTLIREKEERIPGYNNRGFKNDLKRIDEEKKKAINSIEKAKRALFENPSERTPPPGYTGVLPSKETKSLNT